MENIVGNKEWINEWKMREIGKSENQKEKDRKLLEAAAFKDWYDAENLLNEGATPDFVDEDGWTACFPIFFYAVGPEQGAKKVLEKLVQKWKKEIEKLWTICMANEDYFRAAAIINFSGKTEIVTNSKHPIIAILRMMGAKNPYGGIPWYGGMPWKEEYSRKILKDLNLKSTLQTHLSFMFENKITESEEFKKNFSNLSKILKEFNIQVEYDKLTKKFKANLSLALQIKHWWEYVIVTNSGTNNLVIIGCTTILVVLFAYLSNINTIIINYICNNTISGNAELNANVNNRQ